MPDLWNLVLEHLDDNCGTVNTLQLSDLLKVDHQEVVGVVKSLECLGDVVEVRQNSYLQTELTEEGKSFLKNGSHEWILLGMVPPGEDGISKEDLMKVAGSTRGKIGLSKALQNEWVKVVKMGGGVKKVVRLVEEESVQDKVRSELEKIAKGTSSAAEADLKKRKLVVKVQTNYFSLNRGKNFRLDVVKPEAELTPEMLSSGDWKHIKFKQYNFQSLGASLNSGHLHPLLKVRTEFRSILLEMGFCEMASNSFVESSFWNFDALFVPQKHPARDVQDTFFMSQPQECSSISKELMDKVKSARIGKDFGSLGYGNVWNVKESCRNCLRTHTTSVKADLYLRIRIGISYLIHVKISEFYVSYNVFEIRKCSSINRALVLGCFMKSAQRRTSNHQNYSPLTVSSETRLWTQLISQNFIKLKGSSPTTILI